MSTEKYNLRHWTNDRKGVYEVWYLTWNHPGTDQGFWLRYITESPAIGQPGEPRAELWFARFDPRNPDRTFAIHKHFPIRELHSGDDPFSISIAGSKLAHDRASGQLSWGERWINWDLHWDPAPEVLRFLAGAAYAGRGETFEATAQSPNPRVPLSGTLVIDGEELKFDRVPMGQTHIWGRKHAFNWAWGHCNDFVGVPDAHLEVFASRLNRRGITTPPLVMVCLDLDGEQYRMNQMRHFLKNRATWRTGHLTYSAWSPTARIEVELTCDPALMVNAPYVDPDGQELWCANTEAGNARVTLFKRSGLSWREHRTIEAPRRAHFEVGSRERDPAVVREHVLVD